MVASIAHLLLRFHNALGLALFAQLLAGFMPCPGSGGQISGYILDEAMRRPSIRPFLSSVAKFSSLDRTSTHSPARFIVPPPCFFLPTFCAILPWLIWSLLPRHPTQPGQRSDR